MLARTQAQWCDKEFLPPEFLFGNVLDARIGKFRFNKEMKRSFTLVHTYSPKLLSAYVLGKKFSFKSQTEHGQSCTYLNRPGRNISSP